MKRPITVTIASLLFGLSPFALACDYPQRAEILDGATASKDQMLAGQKSVKSYMAAIDEYLACIEKKEKERLAAMEEITDEERANRTDALTKKHNAAVEEMELVAARFNESVRDYKAQSQEQPRK